MTLSKVCKSSTGPALIVVPLCRKSEEILKNAQTMFGSNAFRMELHAMRRKPLVRKRHDETIGFRRHRQDIRHGVAAHDEGMVARREKRSVDTVKNRFSLVFDRRELAMHGFRRPDDLAAISLSERLMAEANPKNRNDGPRGFDEFEADPGIARPAGSRRQHDRVGRGSHDLADPYLVVAMHSDLRAKRAQAMHQVPGETVIIIDESYGCHGRFRSSPRVVLSRARREVKMRDQRPASSITKREFRLVLQSGGESDILSSTFQTVVGDTQGEKGAATARKPGHEERK